MATPKSTTAKTPANPKTTTSKAVTAKAVAKPATAKKTTTATSKKASTSKAKLGDGLSKTTTKISPEERYRMVEVAAYFLAERNGFAGSPVEYWSTAEAQISKLLGK